MYSSAVEVKKVHVMSRTWTHGELRAEASVCAAKTIQDEQTEAIQIATQFNTSYQWTYTGAKCISALFWNEQKQEASMRPQLVQLDDCID